MATSPSSRRSRPDPTHYPVDEEVGESVLHRDLSESFRSLLQRFLASRGVRAFVGADQFIYWRQFAPA